MDSQLTSNDVEVLTPEELDLVVGGGVNSPLATL